MKIATINYTYGGDIVNLSFWNKQDEVLQELNLSRDPVKRSEQIEKYIEEYGITHIEDWVYSYKTGIYLCPIERYMCK
tara:strand:- start:1185 stop:1418 length:234 start_codon:yes stop_codon:yes gene_type:complete